MNHVEELYFALNPWWEQKEFECGILRESYIKKVSRLSVRKQVEIIIGGRRVGKTTFLKQLVKQFLDKGTPANTLFYLALDHPQLASLTIAEHIKKFRQIFMHSREERLVLFLDEIQDSPDWESAVKGIYDHEKVKFICSGSTSALLKSGGGKLTGRQIVTTIYPLSFAEYLLFRDIRVSRAEVYKYEKLVEEYLQTGGYPEFVLRPDDYYLINLLDDIISRDIIHLFTIQKQYILKDLLMLVASSIGSRTSYNKLSRVLKVSLDTIKEYLGYFESAYLTASASKWSPSVTDRIYSTRKFYLLDTGFKTLLTGKGDKGSKAENAVFLHIMRQGYSPCYWAESEKEVDFVVGTYKNPYPIEVKYVDAYEWQDKKFAGMRLFLRRHKETKKALVVTGTVDDEISKGNCTIKFLPLWRFLLNYDLAKENPAVLT